MQRDMIVRRAGPEPPDDGVLAPSRPTRSAPATTPLTADATSAAIQRELIARPHVPAPAGEPEAATAGKIRRSATARPLESPAPGVEPASRMRRGTGTGLPPGLRESVEHLSGVALDDVRVHYESSQPAQLGALAYAQGSDIYVGPGQEEHLPHEAWHVVQQATGRVAPTAQLMRMSVNEDAALEHEADVMGARAMSARPSRPATAAAVPRARAGIVQLKTLKVEGFAKDFANLKAFKGSKDYAALSKALTLRLTDYSANDLVRKTDFFLTQMFSEEDDCVFQSVDHLVHSLSYDIKNKSEDANHTLQEQYMTRYGWKQRERQVAENAVEKPTGKSVKGAKTGKAAPTKGGAKTAAVAKYVPEAEQAPVQQLRVYRTMKLAHYLPIKDVFDSEGEIKEKDFSGLAGHLGDYKEALKYLYGKSPEPKVLIEFTLGPGKESVLFSQSLAFQQADKELPTLERMKKVISGGDGSVNFPKGSRGEGLADDRVGIKSESHGDAGFSLSIGGGSSPNAFMNTIESMKAIGIRTNEDGVREDHGGLDEDALRELAKQKV